MKQRLDKHKLEVMTDFCGLHNLPLFDCILAGKAWRRGGIEAAWESLEESRDAQRELRAEES